MSVDYGKTARITDCVSVVNFDLFADNSVEHKLDNELG